MDISDIIYTIKVVRTALEQKGWYVYSYHNFTVTDGLRMEFHVTIRPPYSSEYDTGWKTDDNIDIRESCTGLHEVRDCANRFMDRGADQLTLVEYMRGRFRQRLADMAEEGDRLGFAMEYGEMLRATAKKLSTNVLTYKPDIVEGVPF